MFVVESRKREATTTIRVVVPDSLHKRLTEVAGKANVDIQEVARQAILYALGQSEGALPPISSRKRKGGLKEPPTRGPVPIRHPEPSDGMDAAPSSNPLESE